MRKEPTRLGHEVSLTVVKAGRNLQKNYHPGQRLAVQPDIYQNGKSTAYGYTVPGGLTQYHLIGPEVLKTDAGECLLPVAEDMGYAESSLLEPWGCVMGAYTQRRRLTPKQGGRMWIIGQPGDQTAYSFSAGLDAPATIVLTDAPDSVKKLAAATRAQVIERNGTDYKTTNQEITSGEGFDDIVMLKPRSADAVSQVAGYIARRGSLNMIGTEPLDGLSSVDFGRLHYDYISFLGNNSTDIAASYGEKRNRCELRRGGITVFVGAGGPMGQMHVQRAVEHPDGPGLVIATDISDERLQTLKDMFIPLAAKNKRSIHFFNPNESKISLRDFVLQTTGGQLADDVVMSVPHGGLMEEAATLMKPDGMLVFFAGVPNGTTGKVDLSKVYLTNAQYTGTSGLTIDDQSLVMKRRMEGTLSPGRSVAAICGLDLAPEALKSVLEGRYPGKVVIFPQIPDLPLMGLKELKDKLPEVAAKLGPDLLWTNEAEEALIDLKWKQPA
jgi:threonine dehydrogenase-like Zn-dependent dehydrogenase